MESQRAGRPTGTVRAFLLAHARVPGDHDSAGGRACRGAAVAVVDEPYVCGAAECGGEDGDGDAGAGECEGEAERGGDYAECGRAGRGFEEEGGGVLEEGGAGDGGGDG